jgi:N-acetyl sugar amidotransferase
MEYCIKCGFPGSRPGLIFKDGVCGACINYENRTKIDWRAREEALDQILCAYKGKTQYDCIIPVSGGKDSYFLVKTICERGMNPLLVTVTDSFEHTRAGTHNLRNLIEKFNLNHYQYTISHDLFRRATRGAFEETGEALKFVEYAIYTIPVKVAQAFGIPLVVFGENSAYEYGTTYENSMSANQHIRNMIDKANSERPMWEKHGVTGKEVSSILPLWPLREESPLVIYMSYFFPWSSLTNLEAAKSLGFKDLSGEWDRKGTIENFEQIDSVAYMIHLWLKYPKFGFQRVTDIATRRVREGKLTLEEAKKLIKEHDPVCDPKSLKNFCDFCGYSEKEFYEIVEKHKRE